MLVPAMCEAAVVLGDEGVDAQFVYSWVVSDQLPSMSEDALSMQCKVPLRSSAAYVLAIGKHRLWVVAKFEPEQQRARTLMMSTENHPGLSYKMTSRRVFILTPPSQAKMAVTTLKQDLVRPP